MKIERRNDVTKRQENVQKMIRMQCQNEELVARCQENESAFRKWRMLTKVTRETRFVAQLVRFHNGWQVKIARNLKVCKGWKWYERGND